MYYSTIFILLSCSIQFGSCLNEHLNEKWFNKLLDEQNPSSVWPPKTDNGVMPPFKYPFTLTQHEVYRNVGWSSQMYTHDLPVAMEVSGVQTRLAKGAIREMHWHIESEWAYVMYGHGRITCVDGQGRAFIDDVKKGDIWLFPGGLPHSIQGTGDDGIYYIPVFNGGLSLFLLTDWLNHIPRDVLAKNFQVPESTFKNMPKNRLSIFKGELPDSLNSERKEVAKVNGLVPQSFKFSASSMKPNVTRKGGNVKIVDARNFPVTDMAAAIVTLKPGALRELHWHKADEWQYYIKGKARMTVFGMGGAARTMNFQEGDVGYVQKDFGHYVENTGNETVVFIEVIPKPFFGEISLTQWLTSTPSKLVNQHIRTGEKFIKSLPKSKRMIVP